MILTVILMLVVGFIGFFIGRVSAYEPYGGKILTEVTDAGTKRFTLEVNSDVEELDTRKSIKFKVVPPQDALL